MTSSRRLVTRREAWKQMAENKAVSCPLTPVLVMIHAEMRGESVYHLPRRIKLLEVDGSSVMSWIVST